MPVSYKVQYKSFLNRLTNEYNRELKTLDESLFYHTYYLKSDYKYKIEIPEIGYKTSESVYTSSISRNNLKFKYMDIGRNIYIYVDLNVPLDIVPRIMCGAVYSEDQAVEYLVHQICFEFHEMDYRRHDDKQRQVLDNLIGCPLMDAMKNSMDLKNTKLYKRAREIIRAGYKSDDRLLTRQSSTQFKEFDREPINLLPLMKIDFDNKEVYTYDSLAIYTGRLKLEEHDTSDLFAEDIGLSLKYISLPTCIVRAKGYFGP